MDSVERPAFPADGQPTSSVPSPGEESIAALLRPYRDPLAAQQRPFLDPRVRDAVVALTRIVRQQAFGYGEWAVVIAQLLRSSEPLEQVATDDLAYFKMRIFLCCYLKRFKDAFDVLNSGLACFPEEPFFGKMLLWLCRRVHQDASAPAGQPLQRRASRKKQVRAAGGDSGGEEGAGRRAPASTARATLYHPGLFPLAKQRAVLASVGKLLAPTLQNLRGSPDHPAVVLEAVAMLLLFDVLQGLGPGTLEMVPQVDQGQPFLCALLRITVYLRHLLSCEPSGDDAARAELAARDILYLVIQVTCPYFLSATWKRPSQEE